MSIKENKKFDWDIIILCIIFVAFLWVNSITKPETTEVDLVESDKNNQELVIEPEEDKLNIIEEFLEELLPNYASKPKENSMSPDAIIEELRPNYMTDTTQGVIETNETETNETETDETEANETEANEIIE